MPGAVIIGAGPGIGQAVARRFTREGMPVALIARKQQTVDAVANALAPSAGQLFPLAADSGDEEALRAALDTAADQLGIPDVVVYNAALIQRDSPGQLSAQAHLQAWAVNVVGAITAAAHIIPRMAERGSGSFIITGGMPEPDPQVVSLSLGKAGVRALAMLLDKQYRPAGVHVATVTVWADVAPGTAFDPDDIAEHYWRLHTEPQEEWTLEVAHTGKPAATGVS